MGTSPAEAAQLNREYGWRLDRFTNEAPQHTVYLKDFYICKYPVTVVEYTRYMSQTGALFFEGWDDPRFNAPDQPVVGVTRHEALAYAEWAGMRLPTEAEWEKASRGADGRGWPWGNYWDPARANSAESGRGYPTPVTAFESAGNVSPYGVCDMVGNVWEWCLDRYDPNFYSDSPRENPCCTLPEIHYDGYYIVRGGSWYNRGDRIRCAARFDRFPQMQRRHIGFRCVKDAC